MKIEIPNDPRTLSLLRGYKFFLQWCGLSRSPLSFLHLVRLFWKNLSRVRLFQITFLFPSLGAASPDHLSFSFTQCGCSGKISQGCDCSSCFSMVISFSFPAQCFLTSRDLLPFFGVAALFSFLIVFFSTLLKCGCSRKISQGCDYSPCFSILPHFSFPAQCFLTSGDLFPLFWCYCTFSFSNHLLFNLPYVRLFQKNLSRMQLFPLLLNPFPTFPSLLSAFSPLEIFFLFSGAATPFPFLIVFILTFLTCGYYGKISQGCGCSPFFSILPHFSFPAQCFLTSGDLLHFSNVTASFPFLIVFYSIFLTCSCQSIP